MYCPSFPEAPTMQTLIVCVPQRPGHQVSRTCLGRSLSSDSRVHTAGNEGPLRDESDYARVVAFRRGDARAPGLTCGLVEATAVSSAFDPRLSSWARAPRALRDVPARPGRRARAAAATRAISAGTS